MEHNVILPLAESAKASRGPPSGPSREPSAVEHDSGGGAGGAGGGEGGDDGDVAPGGGDASSSSRPVARRHTLDGSVTRPAPAPADVLGDSVKMLDELVGQKHWSTPRRGSALSADVLAQALMGLGRTNHHLHHHHPHPHPNPALHRLPVDGRRASGSGDVRVSGSGSGKHRRVHVDAMDDPGRREVLDVRGYRPFAASSGDGEAGEA